MNYTPQQYTPVAPYETPKPRRRRSVLLLMPLVLFGLMFFGGSYLVSPEPDIEVQPGFGFAAVDGQQVVLVPYARHGSRGMFQLLVRDMFQVRIAAANPETGEVLWDTQLSDELTWEASVLAAGERYAYLASDSGLVVLDLHDGSVVAEGDEITGLGSAFVASRSAYGYDAPNHRVMAMNADGSILAIRLDSVSAAPAEPQTDSTWTSALSVDKPVASPPSGTAAEITLGTGERFKLLERVGVPGSVLVRVAPDGQMTAVGKTLFHRAALVVNGPTQHVLVKHSRSVNDSESVLSAVSLATGTVTSSLTVDANPERAATLPDGTTVIATRGELTALAPDGRLTALDIGASDFFGSPS